MGLPLSACALSEWSSHPHPIAQQTSLCYHYTIIDTEPFKLIKIKGTWFTIALHTVRLLRKLGRRVHAPLFPSFPVNVRCLEHE